MQSKGAIKLLAVLLALACVYQLSFTFKTRSVEKKASEYAAQFPLDQQGEAEQHYLDSVQNLPVYNLGFRKFTYKECKEKELNLGLDLKGGMNVMLEVQVEDVVKALAGDSQNDPAFIEAIGVANEAMKQGSSTDYISDFVKAYSRLSNGRPIAELFVSPDRKDITLESSDADVEKILKKETEAAINASFNVLRSRIDHFGVTQPNITRNIPSASVACTRYHGRNAVSISTRYTSGMDNLNFIAIRISKSSMEKQAVNMNNPPQTVCRMLTLLAAFCKYIF